MPRLTPHKIAEAITLTGALYGALGFIYIAGNSWFHQETLPLPLTHFVGYPREDTFGAVCFGVSFISCFVYLLLRSSRR